MFYANPTKTRKSPGRVSGILALFSTLVVTAIISPAASISDPPPSPVSLELGWDPVPEPNVIGYHVYIGTATGQYDRIEDAGMEASHTVTGLVRGVTYYFAVSAFNDQGVEGQLSDELVVTIDTPPVPVDAGIVADSSGTGQVLRWSFPQVALTSSPEIVIEESPDLVTWTEADVVWSGDHTGEDGEMVTFEWPVPTGGGGSMFFRLTARNWLGNSVQP